MLTKGKMIKGLKEMGIRYTPEGKKLEKCKTWEICNLFYTKEITVDRA